MKQFIKCHECGEVQLFDFSNFWQGCTKCATHLIDQHLKPLPALSIKQPWAWLILQGYKPLENRNGLKNFRGDFLIHAGAQFDKKWMDKIHPDIVRLIERSFGLYNQHISTGGIIGHATITGFVEKSDSPWFVGKYGLLIKDPKPLPFTPCKGKLSFFKPEIK